MHHPGLGSTKGISGQGHHDDVACAEPKDTHGTELVIVPVLPLSCCISAICIAPPPLLSRHVAESSADCILSLVNNMDIVSRYGERLCMGVKSVKCELI